MTWPTWLFLGLNAAFWLGVIALIGGYVIEYREITPAAVAWLAISVAMLVGTSALTARICCG